MSTTTAKLKLRKKIPIFFIIFILSHSLHSQQKDDLWSPVLFTGLGYQRVLFQRSFETIQLAVYGDLLNTSFEWTGTRGKFYWSLQHSILLGNTKMGTTVMDFDSNQGHWDNSFLLYKTNIVKFLLGYHILWEWQSWENIDASYFWGTSAAGFQGVFLYSFSPKNGFSTLFRVPVINISRGTGEDDFNIKSSFIIQLEIAWIYNITTHWQLKTNYQFGYTEEYFPLAKDSMLLSLGYRF